MLEDFLSYIESNLSVFREDKILLAVSGGIDSMVMLHLFRQLAYNIEVAHINHSTRNGKSDDDMAFVDAYCRENAIPFHAKTLNYEMLLKGNFQENARAERFSFLFEIKDSRNCKWIATAHHKDDRWETFLMNLNRKSGIKGLTSLRVKENQIIHPLLLFSKKQIIRFGKENNIRFVHDESNDSDAYQRNTIRHKITPEIVELFSNFIENANRSITHLDNTSSLLNELIDQHEFVTQEWQTGHIHIALERIKTFNNKVGLLYFIIEGFGFNYSTAHDILLTSNTGTRFESKDYEGLFDRGNLIVRKKRASQKTNFTIDSPGTYYLQNGKKLLVKFDSSSQKASHLWIDSKKIKWPLVIRNIQPGDKFKPQGMKGATKSIKKLCTDLKVNRFAKEDMLVVCQEDIIIQVVGIRNHCEYATVDIKNALTFNIIA